jgi:hypothetical protein
MAPGRTLRILLALLLLSAQQTALSHQLWHYFKIAPQPAQEQLCGHHDALGTVAGALDAPAMQQAGEAPAQYSISTPALPAASTSAPAPSSRGPPAFL